MRLSTDTPIDKIVKYLEATITIQGYDYNDVNIPHEFAVGLPYQARWSFSPSFVESFEETTAISSMRGVFVGVSNGVNNCIVMTDNNNPTPVTIYVRIAILARGGVNINSQETQTGLDAFNINTDYNYPKLIAEPILGRTGGSYDHNLGYIPQVDAWTINNSGYFSRYRMSDMSSWPLGLSDGRLTVSDTSILYECPQPFPNASGLYIRVYEDRI